MTLLSLAIDELFGYSIGDKQMTKPKFTPTPWTIYEKWNGSLEIHGNEREIDGEVVSDVIAENVLE